MRKLKKVAILVRNKVEETRKVHWNIEFISAVKSNNIQKARIALKLGADVNTQDKLGDTALIAAVMQNNLEAVKLLVAHKADIDWQSRQSRLGHTALMWAAIRNCSKIAKFLIEKKANVHQLSFSDDKTVLMLAVSFNCPLEIVKELLAVKGINVNQQNKHGYTALSFVQDTMGRQRDIEGQKQIKNITTLLLEKGANPLIKDQRGKTVLDEEGNEIGEVIEEFKQKKRKKTSELLEPFLPSVLAALIAEFKGTPIDPIEDL